MSQTNCDERIFPQRLIEVVTKGYRDQTPRQTEERELVSSGQYSGTQVLVFLKMDRPLGCLHTPPCKKVYRLTVM